MSTCMKWLGLECQHTEDEKGQQRFLGMGPLFIARFNGKGGYFRGVYNFWAKDTGEFKAGADLVSEQANGFHWLRSRYMILRNYAVLYPEDACPKDSKLVQSYLDFYAEEDDDDDTEEEGEGGEKEDVAVEDGGDPEETTASD